MFIVNGKVIKFNHERVESRIVRTVCTITDDEGVRILARASCFVHPNDNPCRSTGRKLSLTRAAKNFDKETRTEIWNEYFKNFKK